MTVRTLRAAGRLVPPLVPDLLLNRIRGEYREMPGLQLTDAQAARLLGIDPVACRVLLDHLWDLGFLRRGERGQYVLAGER